MKNIRSSLRAIEEKPEALFSALENFISNEMRFSSHRLSTNQSDGVDKINWLGLKGRFLPFLNHESVVFTCVVIPYVFKVRKNGKINELGPNLKFEVCLLFSGLCAKRNFTLCHENNELSTRMTITH